MTGPRKFKEETRHRYGRLESRLVSDWQPLEGPIFMCDLSDIEGEAEQPS